MSQAQRDLLARQITRRFGSLAEAARRIDCSYSTIQRWRSGEPIADSTRARIEALADAPRRVESADYLRMLALRAVQEANRQHVTRNARRAEIDGVRKARRLIADVRDADADEALGLRMSPNGSPSRPSVVVTESMVAEDARNIALLWDVVESAGVEAYVADCVDRFRGLLERRKRPDFSISEAACTNEAGG